MISKTTPLYLGLVTGETSKSLKVQPIYKEKIYN